MQIAVRGSGTALVMIHGWAMDSGIFAPLAERLEKMFTLYLVDLPGHGYSGESAIALELDAVARHIATRTPRAIWLGWSLGGLLALHAAQQWPAAVRGLVMVCASPRFVRGSDWPLGMDETVLSEFADALHHDCRGTLDRFLMLQAQGSGNTREQLRRMRNRLFAHGEPNPEKLRDGLSLLQKSDLRAGLGTLLAPSLWLAGRRDHLIDAQAIHSAAQSTPHSQFKLFENGGHAPFETHTDEVASAIENFARSLAL